MFRRALDRLALHAFVWAALSATTAAQSSLHLMQDRDREDLHPGDPLDVVGIAEGGNDFRARTPALTKSDMAVVMVDEDVNYRRRLAMYEETASYSTPLPVTSPRNHFGVGPKNATPVPEPIETNVRQEAERGIAWLLGLAVGLVLVAWALLRRGRLFGWGSSDDRSSRA